jgi:hypothetical protein
MEADMKRLLIALLVGVGIYTGMVMADSRSYASSVYESYTDAFVCVPDGRGGMCCWETTVEGPFRPVSC